jgi:predicted CoA-binding protein
LAKEAGITLVQDKCMKEQYEQLFTESKDLAKGIAG